LNHRAFVIKRGRKRKKKADEVSPGEKEDSACGGEDKRLIPKSPRGREKGWHCINRRNKGTGVLGLRIPFGLSGGRGGKERSPDGGETQRQDFLGDGLK